MSIKYNIQTHGDVLSDAVNKSYSDPALNAALATAEKFFVVAKATNVTGGSPTLKVTIELSNDGMNWIDRGSPVIAATSITVGGTTVLKGFDDGVTNGFVGGRFMRVAALLGGGGPPGAYVEVWVCGRSLV